jgi:hypothetical protein
MECKKVAEEVTSQQEGGRDWFDSQCYWHEEGAPVVASTQHYRYQSTYSKPGPHQQGMSLGGGE